MALHENRSHASGMQGAGSSSDEGAYPTYIEKSAGGSDTFSEYISNRPEIVMCESSEGQCNIYHNSYSDGEIAYTSSDNEGYRLNFSQIPETESWLSQNTKHSVPSFPQNDSENILDKTRLISIINENHTSSQSNENLSTMELYVQKPFANTIFKGVKKLQKSVRFSDQLGHELTSEYIIKDSALPPLLTRMKIDGTEFDKHQVRIYPTYDNTVLSTHSPIADATANSCHSNSDNRVQTSTSDEITLSPRSQRSGASDKEICSEWRLKFCQPDENDTDFKAHLESNNVSLANLSAAVSEPHLNSVRLRGKVQVKDVALHKEVKLRVTNDRWTTFHDYNAVQYNAEFSSASADSEFVTYLFDFTLTMPKSNQSWEEDFSQQNQEIQFAIRYAIGEASNIVEYWDNNSGENYTLVACMKPKLSVLIRSKRIMNKSVAANKEKIRTIEKELMPLNYRRTDSDNYLESDICLNGNARMRGPMLACRNSLTNYSTLRQYSTENVYY